MRHKVFYKYRPANDYTIALLEKQEMKFSYAEEYNDPFDSKLTINIDGDINNHRDAILKELEETPIKESVKQSLRERIRSGEFSMDQHLEIFRETAKRTIMSSCFAGNYKDLLLWSHYADSHKGICVGLRSCSSTDIHAMKFNVKECYSDPNDPFSDGIFAVYKVNYSDYGIIEWKPYAEDFQPFMDAHRNKAKCWEYEDEYRLIVSKSAFTSKILRFDPHYLMEVYLGCCIETDFRAKVLQVLKANYLSNDIDVKIFDMVRSKKRFALEKKMVIL